MIVKELIDVLNKCPMDAKVVIGSEDDFNECIDVTMVTKREPSLFHQYYLDRADTIVYLKDTSDDYEK